MVLIGITGKKYHGKTSVAEYLTREYGFFSLSFADALKKAVSVLWDIPIWNFESPALKELVDERWGKSPREIMQLFGTEVVRSISPNLWIYNMERVLIRTIYDRIVISDIRFLDEAEMVRKWNGKIFKVVREGFVDTANTTTEHLSEKNIDLIKEDVLLRAKSGGIHFLYSQIDEAVKPLLGTK